VRFLAFTKNIFIIHIQTIFNMWAVLFGSRRGAMLQGSLAFGLSFLESGLRPPLRSATAPNSPFLLIQALVLLMVMPQKREAFLAKSLPSYKLIFYSTTYSVLINFLTDTCFSLPINFTKYAPAGKPFTSICTVFVPSTMPVVLVFRTFPSIVII